MLRPDITNLPLHPDDVSKVTDPETGEPMVVYHGSQKAGFSVFDTDGNGKTTGTGAWFADTERGASTYSNRNGVITEFGEDEDGYIDEDAGNYAVFLNLKNPVVEDFGGNGWQQESEEFFVEDSDGEVVEWFTNEGDADAFMNVHDDEGYTLKREYTTDNGLPSTDDVARMARENGEADGVIIENVNDEGRFGQGYGWANHSYVAFSPNQIKSATSNTGEYAAGNDDIRFSIADTNNHAQTFTPDPYDAKEFANIVDAVLSSEQTPRKFIRMGDTPAVLRAIGATAQQIQIQASVIKKANDPTIREHDVPASVLRNLPSLLSDPIGVFDSRTEKGALLVFVEAKDASGRDVAIAVHLNTKGDGFAEINKIASVYGRQNAAGEFSTWANEGGLRYYNTKKAARLLHGAGLQLPRANTIKRLNPKSITEADVVNGDDINV
ncbi:hypothetical protein FACS189497_15190 [Betaproteobacteria bacterium]|nr:hypothetical protein FACS189497_15190 [Betaproteobacteria bacterium]